MNSHIWNHQITHQQSKPYRRLSIVVFFHSIIIVILFQVSSIASVNRNHSWYSVFSIWQNPQISHWISKYEVTIIASSSSYNKSALAMCGKKSKRQSVVLISYNSSIFSVSLYVGSVIFSNREIDCMVKNQSGIDEVHVWYEHSIQFNSVRKLWKQWKNFKQPASLQFRVVESLFLHALKIHEFLSQWSAHYAPPESSKQTAQNYLPIENHPPPASLSPTELKLRRLRPCWEVTDQTPSDPSDMSISILKINFSSKIGRSITFASASVAAAARVSRSMHSFPGIPKHVGEPATLCIYLVHTNWETHSKPHSATVSPQPFPSPFSLWWQAGVQAGQKVFSGQLCSAQVFLDMSCCQRWSMCSCCGASGTRAG